MAYALTDDTPTTATVAPLTTPRAIGSVRLSAKRREEATALATLRHQGSAKAMFPAARQPSPNAPFDAVLLNTAGGVTGGDRFDYTGAAEPGAWLRLSTQTAERAYRAQPGEIGRITTKLTAADGARIDWTPQETILFDGCSVARRLEVDLAAGARLLAVEPLVFGRAAMGERLDKVFFADQWWIRRGGRLVYADAFRLDGSADAILRRAGVLGGAGAMASLVYVGDDAESRLLKARALLSGDAGASLVRDGVLAVRLVAPSSYDLRRMITPLIEALGDAALPKVWTL